MPFEDIQKFKLNDNITKILKDELKEELEEFQNFAEEQREDIIFKLTATPACEIIAVVSQDHWENHKRVPSVY